MFFTSSAMVLAETPSNFKIDSDDIYMLYGADYLGHNSTLNLTFKKTTDGKIVYCIEHMMMLSIQVFKAIHYQKKCLLNLLMFWQMVILMFR